jgi:4'-phosphopantetheinyl transferase
MRGTALNPTRPKAEDAVPVVTATFSRNGFEAIVACLDVGRTATAAAAAVLSKDELERANRFVFQRDRDRFIVARAGLRRLLAQRLGLAANAIRFEYGVHGKPFLANESDVGNLRFNVSHSHDMAIYAFTHGRDIGVDIEAVREVRDNDDIAAHCFSADENRMYSLLDIDERSQGFFNCWTRKEAFIKAIGDGLHYPLDSFAVSLRPDEPARILRVGDKFGKDCGWQLYSFSPVRGFVSAIVVEHTNAAEWS